MSSRFCPSCGTELTQNARFCNNCGKEVSRACQSCGAELPEGARFCTKCGKEFFSPLIENQRLKPLLHKEVVLPSFSAAKQRLLKKTPSHKKLTIVSCVIVAGLLITSLLYFHPFGSNSSKTVLEAKQLLKDAINYTGTYPTPREVSYTYPDGQTETINAYPGQVQVFFNKSIGEAQAQVAIQANEGKVLGQIPSLGYYLVGVAVGSEGDFIALISKGEGVDLVLPNMPAMAKQGEVYLDTTWLTDNKSVPLNVKPGIIFLDYFIEQIHGEKVIQSADKEGGSAGSAVHIGIKHDTEEIAATTETSHDKVYAAIIAAAAGNNIYNPGQPTLINLSSSGGGDKDYTTLLSPAEQKEAKDSWKEFTKVVLEAIVALPLSLRENLVLTQCAGNENMPIGDLLAELRSDPKLKDVMENNYLCVSSTLGNFNYDSGDPAMAIMNNASASWGTSLAAPAAMAIVQQIIKQTELSATQALKAVKLALKENPKHELVFKEAMDKAKLIKQQSAKETPVQTEQENKGETSKTTEPTIVINADRTYRGTLTMTVNSVESSEYGSVNAKYTMTMPFDKLPLVRIKDTDMVGGGGDITFPVTFTEDWSLTLNLPTVGGVSYSVSPTSGHFSASDKARVYGVYEDGQFAFCTLVDYTQTFSIQLTFIETNSSTDPPYIDKRTIDVPHPFHQADLVLGKVTLGTDEVMALLTPDFKLWCSTILKNSQIRTSKPDDSSQNIPFSGSYDIPGGKITYQGNLALELIGR